MVEAEEKLLACEGKVVERKKGTNPCALCVSVCSLCFAEKQKNTDAAQIIYLGLKSALLAKK